MAKQLGLELSTTSNEASIRITFVKKATWPWKEKDVAKIVQSLEKFKTIFILALNGETLQVVRTIQDRVEDVNKSVEKMAISDRHKRILKWLKVTDPSVNHNAARDKHEPTTGDWLLESEIFTNWTGATTGSLWLYGKPGAGKTILCSTLIEHVKLLCAGESTDRYAYFYFDFSDTQKQTVSNMLCSIVAQLSVSILSHEVDQLYHRCKDGQHRPCQHDLIETLVTLLNELPRTYLIVDALDECSERTQLLDSLRKIIQRTATHANVLVTSREEHDISKSLEGIISKSVSLEGGGLDSDIKRHIQKCLENDVAWKNDTSEVKQEIQETLVQGAHGM